MTGKLCSFFARTASREEHNLLQLARMRKDGGEREDVRACWVPIRS